LVYWELENTVTFHSQDELIDHPADKYIVGAKCELEFSRKKCSGVIAALG